MLKIIVHVAPNLANVENTKLKIPPRLDYSRHTVLSLLAENQRSPASVHETSNVCLSQLQQSGRFHWITALQLTANSF